MHAVGIVLHPQRDSKEAVDAVLSWAGRNGVTVYGIGNEIARLNCAATPVSAEELGKRSDLLVSLGGDGTMLRAMRLADGQRAPVLGVNLGKLGFLAEVDVPDLANALTAIDERDYTTEPRLAVDSVVGEQRVTAFNDIAVVRVPGDHTAAVAPTWSQATGSRSTRVPPRGPGGQARPHHVLPARQAQAAHRRLRRDSGSRHRAPAAAADKYGK